MSQSLESRNVLVVDDHRNIRLALRMTLEEEGANVTEAEGVKAALGKLNKDPFPYDVILLDVRMPDGNGLEVLKTLSEANFSSRVIMISGEGTVNEAFQATQMGAFDYVEKPFTSERILVSVKRALDYNQLQRRALKGREILGSHKSIKEVQKVIARVAPTNGRVLIVGETGTGKELVARSLHLRSQRNQNPLVKVNCAAIPSSLIESELFGHEKGAFTGAIKNRKGLFEQANGGTIFLDEIGELSLEVQAKLLRILETGEMNRLGSESLISVNVRIIAATHRNLQEMVDNKEFREDLFYRLNVVTIEVPPLRDRGDDIVILANQFLAEACEEHSLGNRSFSKVALHQLKGHHWPGNIRELRNIVDRVSILSENEEIPDIEGLRRQQPKLPSGSEPGEISGDFQFGTDLVSWQEFHKEIDKAYIKFALLQAEGNVSEAARLLCLERAYLHRLMKKLGVQRDVVID